jgi:hypothetical protein
LDNGQSRLNSLSSSLSDLGGDINKEVKAMEKERAEQEKKLKAEEEQDKGISSGISDRLLLLSLLFLSENQTAPERC